MPGVWFGAPAIGPIELSSMHTSHFGNFGCADMLHHLSDEKHLNEEPLMVKGKGKRLGFTFECFHCHQSGHRLAESHDRDTVNTGGGC